MQELEWDSVQQEAITNCCDLSKRVYPVTGPAGAGKTSLLKRGYSTLVDAGYEVVLVAPTGKAAKRIYEATGLPACTIHRALKYSSPGERDQKTGKYIGVAVPAFDADNRWPYDAVYADEYAMVNRETHRALVSAMAPGSVLRPFGDMHQLQPVETTDEYKSRPSPFKELLDKFKGTVLTRIYRQDEGSSIIANSQRILSGLPPQRADGFAINYTETPVNDLERFVFESLDDGIDYSKQDNQIITPINKSWVGTHALNAMVQRCFFDMKDAHPLERHQWEKSLYVALNIGDKVVNSKNNYDLEFFNGEGGTVKDITNDGVIVIDDGEREIWVPPYQEITIRGQTIGWNPQRELYLAYALTTHKTQGSEYQHIAYVLNKSAYYVINRPNFYTAVTRARKSVTIFTDQKSIWQAVQRTGDFNPPMRRGA